MKNRLPILFFALCTPLLLVALLFSLPAPARTAPAGHSPTPAPTADQPRPFLIYLHQQADLTPAGLPQEITARRAAVVARLQRTAATSQSGLLAHLDALQAAGAVTRYHSLWIANAVAVTGRPDAITALAARPEVDRITPDEPIQYLAPLTPTTAAPTALTWGLRRIRTPHVWDGLGIDGSGVTIAIMDSGVDWTHPALAGNYRGAPGDHAGHWFDAIAGTPAPADPHGHGTHVAGTAAGQTGTGVAPGAQWIATRVFDQYGFTSASVLHQGFQWLLAPAGDPALAPDVINGSWGSTSFNDDFLSDVAALHAAGIVTVFSAGNAGPAEETVSAPASYAGAIAAAASDPREQVAWFSGRGPSPLTGEPKPTLAAPGARVLSALPGNLYGYLNGTSMAAPHAAGTAALLLSANPGLGRAAVTAALTATTVPLSVTHPNDASGWGRLDAYAAVAPHVTTGRVEGTVFSSGQPLAGAVVTITTAGGVALPFQADGNGHYVARLRPGTYGLETAPFGHNPAQVDGVVVQGGAVAIYNLRPTRLPYGTVSGGVRDARTQAPLPATVSAQGTPVTATAGADGSYALALPAGTYTLVAAHTGHKLGRATVTVPAGGTAGRAFALTPAPTILLVDAGHWYYGSVGPYYHDTLAALDLAHDSWPIYAPTPLAGQRAVPTAADLLPYDIVLWSAPQDAPGVLGAGDALTDYLVEGGKLFISGQNVADIDGIGLDTQVWWYDLLRGRFGGEAIPPFTVSGAPGTVFAGFTAMLNGGDSANNQIRPDWAAPREGSLTETALRYGDDTGAGLLAGRCDPYQIAYLGFGLEGVATQAARADLLERSLDHFAAPPAATGLSLTPDAIDDYALPGRVLTYTFTARNLSESLTDTIHLDTGGTWASHLLTPTLTLGPCQRGDTTLTLAVPPDLPPGTDHTLHLTATSTNAPSVQATAILSHRTPGRFLLVDDDRWYDQQATFLAALDAIALPVDVWDTTLRGSPAGELLQAYEMVLWFTGYDWYRPVTDAERQALEAYLAGGGRLFLTSQDFLYYHGDEAMTNTYLGVLDYGESVTPTVAYGGDNARFGDPAGPFPLSYTPYQNFSDGLIPAGHSAPFLWHNKGFAAGVATAGADWRTAFWAIPLETLPADAHATALDRVVGWLSDLGDSTFAVDRRVGPGPATRTYTLTLRTRPGMLTTTVAITNTLPPSLTLDASSVTGGAVYEAGTRQLTWQGTLPPGGVHVIGYQAAVAGGVPAGAAIANPVTIHAGRQDVRFGRVATSWVDAPDLTGATVALADATVRPGQDVTVTVRLRNDGVATGTVSATVRLPRPLGPLTDTLSSSAGTATLADHRLQWMGQIGPGRGVTLTLSLSTTTALRAQWLLTTLLVDDGATAPIIRDVLLHVSPHQFHFPFIARP